MEAALARADAIREVVISKARLRPTAGGSKPALSGWGNLVLDDLSGVLEYRPEEFTITVLAGTPVAEVTALLAENGQYLPCDPPLAAAGATLGGTVASGLSGPGRYRYGGVRDFLLGVRLVTGGGELVTGGGKVVKNAAGFDIPKLMVGSLGRLGVLLELTFKVFPRPERLATLHLELASFQEANAVMQSLAGSSLDLACLDLTPPTDLWLRLGGLADALPQRLARLEEEVGRASSSTVGFSVLEGDADAVSWRQAREFDWVPEGHSLVKLPLNPARLTRLERKLEALETSLEHVQRIPRRYSVAGNVAWLAWPEALSEKALRSLLADLGLTGLAITGRWSHPQLGRPAGEAFLTRLLSVFDPEGKLSLGGQDAA